jgi:tetratricopeptide (TPR) repeat protein
MMARLVGIVLGTILATSGYVIAGLGVLGDWAQNLDLGPFEPHRPFVGWVAAITGALLIVAALTPRPKPKARRKPEPVDLGPDLVAAPVLAVEIAEIAQTLNRLLRMASDDREKALSRRDLGDFARGQGRLDEAAEAYEEAVSYARAVRAAKPGDFADDDLLAGALSGVGDVAEMEGRLNDALSAFEEALALRRSQGGREAADPTARRALSVSLERLADLREDRGHRMRALDLYRESYDVAARLAAADPTRFGADLASTRTRLAELEAKVAG